MKPSMNGPLYGWLNDFSIIFQGISRCVFQRGYKVLLGSFKGVSEKSRRCFPSVSRNYSRPLKHVSRGSHGKIYYCRLVRPGLWEPVHNKPWRKIFQFHNKHHGKHYTTSEMGNILQQAWETDCEKSSALSLLTYVFFTWLDIPNFGSKC